MKLRTNVFAQIVAIAAQAANQYADVIPPKTRPLVALVIGIAQLIVGYAAHFSNTNGTPQEVQGGAAAPGGSK